MTHNDLREIDRESWLCSVAGWDYEPRIQVVQEMHEKNGLLQELEDAFVYRTFYAIDDHIYQWVTSRYDGTEPLFPAGSSVHFDLDFCRKRFPTFTSLLHYRHLDVSSVKLFEVACGNDYDPGPDDRHRALSDLDNDINWLKSYRARVNGEYA